MEEIEYHDWGVTYDMDNAERRQRSIEAYWLPKWYSKIEDLTFPTQFYKELPATFTKSMVRWESKSPKDSEFWGPVETKEQALNLFYTSLRCKTDPGSIYCLREWKQLSQEWRCFWNGRVTAISGDVEPTKELVDYLETIAHRIPYYRCVMDISLAADGKFYIVEFNSWETNSGAHLFEWTEELLYDSQEIVCRWPGGEKTFEWSKPSTLPLPPTSDVGFAEVHALQSDGHSSWLIKNSGLYVCNDVWLVQLDADLKPLRWRRGPFRFDHLEEATDGLKAGDKVFYDDLSPNTHLRKSKSSTPHAESFSENGYPKPPYRYGFVGLYQNRYVFCRFVGETFYPVFY